MTTGDYHRVSYWLQSVTAKARGAPVVVVGTRADLCSADVIADTFAKMQQQFSHFGVKHYLAVSAHTGKGLKYDYLTCAHTHAHD
jgi:predicted GTPase